MTLQHKSKLRVYGELKWKIGFEEYVEYVKFRWGTHGLLEELGRHDKGGGLQECCNCGASKELVEHVLF